MNANDEHPRVRVPPPLVFLGYLVAALVLNWLFPFPEPWATILRVVGGVCIIAGLALGGTAVSRMLKAGTSPDPDQAATALITDGPYRFTRNPIYLGFLLIFLGFTLLAGTLWGLVLSPFLIWTVTRIVIRAEEGYLSVKFAERYEDYKSRARRWI